MAALLSAADAPLAPIKLPAPRLEGSVSLEAALAKRRSVRSFTPAPVTLAETAQLLWAAQGVTGPRGQRTAPSARARYPLEIYAVPFNADGIPRGVHKYNPKSHELAPVTGEDRRDALLQAAGSAASIKQSGVLFLIVMNYQRMGPPSNENTRKFTHMETGLAVQNLLMEAVALNLGAVVVGGINPEAVKKAAGLPPEEDVMCVVPVGRPQPAAPGGPSGPSTRR